MRLSVGITAIVFVFIPFTTLSFMAVLFIFNESIEFAIFGSFFPYSVLVTSFLLNPMRSPKSVPLSVEASNVINDPKCNKGPECNNFWP